MGAIEGESEIYVRRGGWCAVVEGGRDCRCARKDVDVRGWVRAGAILFQLSVQ